MNKPFKVIFIILLVLFCYLADGSIAQDGSDLKFEISFDSDVHPQAITGRVYLIISRDNSRELRFQTRRSRSSPFFGVDVENLQPGELAIIDKSVLGFPLNSIADIPAGEYFVQGFVNIYTKFERSDGFTFWLHND